MKKLLLFGLLLANFTLFAQQNCQFTLSGTLLDSTTKIPLEYARIGLDSLKLGAFTNSQGKFELKNLCPGSYQLTIQHISCLNKLQSIEVKKDTNLTLYIAHHAEIIHFIEYNASTHDESEITSKTTVEGEELEKKLGEDLGSIIEDVPGVTVVKTGSTINKPIIHGQQGQRILLYQNGVRLSTQDWGSEHAPPIDPFQSSSITVLKGPSALRYGASAIGGVVIAEPGPIQPEKPFGMKLFNAYQTNDRSFHTGLQVDARLKKLPWVGVRLSTDIARSGDFKTAHYFVDNTGTKSRNHYLQVDIDKNKWNTSTSFHSFHKSFGIYSGSHIGNLTDLKSAIATGEPQEETDFSYTIEAPYQFTIHEILSHKMAYWVGKTSQFQLNLSRQYNFRNEYDSHNDDDNDGEPSINFNLTSHQAEFIYKHEGEKWKRIGGFQFMKQKNTQTGARRFIPNYLENAYGFFWEERYDSQKLSMEAILRYDFIDREVYRYEQDLLTIPEFMYSFLNASLGAAIQLKEGMDIHLNVGTATRAPHVSEQFSDGIHHGTASFEVGDADLVPERSWASSILFNYQKKGLLHGSIELYDKVIDNFIYLAPQEEYQLTVSGAFPLFKYTQTKAHVYGLDVIMNISPFTFPLQVQNQLSIIRAWDLNTSLHLPFYPADRFSQSFQYQLKDIKKLTNNLFEVGYRYVFKQTRVDESFDFAPTPNAYVLLDATVSTCITSKKHEYHFFVSVENLLNQNYKDYLNRMRYFIHDRGRSINLKFMLHF